MRQINDRLTPVLKFFTADEYTKPMSPTFTDLPSRDDIVNTATQLIEVTEQIQRLQDILNLKELV